MRGIVTVLNIPFTKSNHIDIDGLCANVDYAIEAGVAGFLVPALASEVGSLSETERNAIVKAVVDTSAGRVPIVGGASADTQELRVRLATDLISLGCGGVLVNMPLSDEGIFERDLAEIAEVGGDFVMLQDWDPVGEGLPIPFIQHLYQSIEQFTWLKIEVIPAGPKYTRVLEATDGRLNVSGGWAVMQMIEALDRGVHVFMPTGMHRIYARTYELFEQGEHEAARELFEQVLPVLAFSNQRLDISIHFFKRLLHRQGLYATPNVRPPIEPLDAFQERTADVLIERVIALEKSLLAQT